MDKKTIIIIIVALLIVIILAVAGYLLWKSRANGVLGNAAEKITEDATRGVLPSLETNPLGNKPDANPAAAANPIKNIKTNPFE